MATGPFRGEDGVMLGAGIAATATFDEGAGHRLNITKSGASATTAAGRREVGGWKVKSQKLKHSPVAKTLGAAISVYRRPPRELARKRTERAVQTLRKLQRSAAPRGWKTRAIAAKPFRQAFYGVAVVMVGPPALARMMGGSKEDRMGQAMGDARPGDCVHHDP